MVRIINQIISIAILWLTLLISGPAAATENKPVYIFAAASMIDALGEIVESYNQNTGVRIVPSFAGSSVLARQIASGAPVDLFLSANSRWMDYLIARDVIAAADSTDLIANRLVLISPKGTLAAQQIDEALPLKRLLGDGYLAIGDPDHVPAGIYAREALQNLQLWQDVAARTVRLPNVRNVLALARSGEVPLAVVYQTDAQASANVDIVGIFPKAVHAPIRYRLGLTTTRSKQAVDFYRYLQSDAARHVFIRYGFSPLE